MGRSLVARVCHAVLATTLLLLTIPHEVSAQADDLACAQQPGNRFFWVERAFCDLALNGPDRANGVVIWNHRMSGTNQSSMAPAPPILRLLHACGSALLMLTRHPA